MPKSLARSLLVVGLLALVGGCDAAYIAPYGTHFTSESSTALVIVGTQLIGSRITNAFGSEIYPPVTLKWSGTAADSGKPVKFYSMPATVDATVEERRQVNYTVYEVTPGRYMLADIVALNRITHMNDPAHVAGFDAPAGQITYIGTYTINAQSFPASVERFTRNDAAAVGALKPYYVLKGEPHYGGLIKIPNSVSVLRRQ